MKTAFIESSQIQSLSRPLKTEGTLVVMPVIDLDMGKRAALLAASLAKADGLLLVVQDSARMGRVRVHNEVFRRSVSPHYAYLAQDAFTGRDWLALGLAALARREGRFLGFNDGKWHGQMAAFGLVQREWAESQYGGPLFFEGYQRHYADVELTLIAREQGCYAYEPAAMVAEVDWHKEAMAVDPDDKRLFRERASDGFASRVQTPELRALFG